MTPATASPPPASGPHDGSELPDDVRALGFAAASAELERILTDLEREAVDVDVLAAKVARAALLIRHCRGRIAEARVTVHTVVADLDGPAAVAPTAGSDEPDPEPR